MEFARKWKFDLKQLDASIIIPAFNEGVTIQKTLAQLSLIKNINFEVLIVVDSKLDITYKSVVNCSKKPKLTSVLLQNYGTGPANAIRFGIDQAVSECYVIMMADGSDDARVIPDLVNLVTRGVAVACASRYMPGGQQIGGPRFKKFLSKLAGKLLYRIAGISTHDPTNSFKAYSKAFIESEIIESRSGFEVGIELISKAHRRRLSIAEVPTIWLDRSRGKSNFQLTKWIPKYLKWFIYCFGPVKALTEKAKKEWKS